MVLEPDHRAINPISSSSAELAASASRSGRRAPRSKGRRAGLCRPYRSALDQPKFVRDRLDDRRVPRFRIIPCAQSPPQPIRARDRLDFERRRHVAPALSCGEVQRPAVCGITRNTEMRDRETHEHDWVICPNPVIANSLFERRWRGRVTVRRRDRVAGAVGVNVADRRAVHAIDETNGVLRRIAGEGEPRLRLGCHRRTAPLSRRAASEHFRR
jgi:hypothetical protein